MNRRFLEVALCALMATSVAAQKAVMHDDHPAVECRYDSGKHYDRTWTIERVYLNGKPAFKIPVLRVVSQRVINPSTLFITDARFILRANETGAPSFNESRTAVRWLPGNDIVFELAGSTYDLVGRTVGSWEWLLDPLRSGPCGTFVSLVLSDFVAADKEFDQLTGSLPPSAREVAWRNFQPKAAAWQLLTVKPPIPDKVRQRRLLAEDAFNEKRFETAAAEYEAGLEIDPLWPAGHFNAALIYAELKKYGDAAWHMRCYLELVPNAPDAQEARDHMLLWQGKAEEQETAPAK